MLFSGQGVGISAGISAVEGVISYQVPTAAGRRKHEMPAVQTGMLPSVPVLERLWDLFSPCPNECV